MLRPFMIQQLMAEALMAEALTDEERQQARELFGRQHGLRDAVAFEQFRRSNFLTPKDMEEWIERPLRLQHHCDRHFRARAEARFLERKTQLDRVVYSLLRLQDAGLARELYLRIAEGEADFGELAALYAEGPEQATRGVIGPVPLTQAHPTLADRLRTASPGVPLEPFPLQNWWLVVRLERFSPASFDRATADLMAQELFQHWLDEQVESRLAGYGVEA